MKNRIKKICIIGNSCSGKTVLAKQLASHFNLKIWHVDSIQYLPGLQWREPNETRKILSDITYEPQWIIDGLGPLKILEERMKKADMIVVLRPPLPIIYWRLLKRQITGIFKQREELPENCFEATPGQTLRMMKTIWNVHHGLWLQLDRIFEQPEYKDKVFQVFREKDISKLINKYA
jgi:adenylate kinase family enzyme